MTETRSDAPTGGSNFDVVVVETPGLGDRSYLVHDGRSAFVVDAPRDIDRILDLAADLDVEIEAIFETHLHNDYVSGGLSLSRRTGAILFASGDDDRSFDHAEITDGQTITVGTMTVEARWSPGHTHSHLAFIARSGDRVRAVFTGGSLLYGTVGRTDLLGESETDELTRHQWQTVRRLVEDLPDDTAVYPTHGFGSFCSAQAGADRDEGTIADEYENPAVVNDDVDSFVAELLAGLSDAPAYYAHMSHLNRAGAGEPDLSPTTVIDTDELAARIEAGEWVVDLRNRRTYAHRHLVGTLNFEADGLPTHLGWLIPWQARLTLLADDDATIADAQRALSRIGLDRPSRSDLSPALSSLPDAGYEVVTFAELESVPVEDRTFTVIDVRRQDEYEKVHLDGAVNIPLHQLLDHLHHVPEGPLWVHCGSGARASIAASLLARAGREVTLVDGGPEDTADPKT